jgi:hypothetical protein
MRALRLLLIPLACALLGACSGVSIPTQLPAGTTTPRPISVSALAASLGQITHEDLLAAEADATAHGDVVAMPCYSYIDSSILPLLPGGADSMPVKGAFSAFQKARNVALLLQNGVPAQFQLACGPLLMDTQAGILRLGVIAAGSAASGGVLGPALPALGAALPIPLP